VFAAAYGDADRETHVANTVDTRFRIGSMNKMFTATAIMQLVQAGKIKLEDPFGKYIADYPNKSVADTVSIHQLLTHTGGTGDFLGPDYLAHQKELKDLKDTIALFGAREAAFRPGSQFEYSNFGYIILGRVIETVSGKPYDDYVHENIFVPAEMTATDSGPAGDAAAGISVGYTMDGGGGLHSNTATVADRGTPAGGGTSTVADLIKFADALASHKFLDAETTATMTTGKVEMGGSNALYGYGFGDITEGSVRHFGHNGGAPGMNGDLSIFPRSGYQVAVLANMDPPSANRLAAFIAAKLPVQ
jgi:CubicO group peptidase (beta-lactamase class C family)